jgi:hypothetical protein
VGDLLQVRGVLCGSCCTCGVSCAIMCIVVWPGWIEGPMEFTQTAAWLRRDYTEQVLDWSRDKGRLGITRYSDKVRSDIEQEGQRPYIYRNTGSAGR